MAVFVKTNTFWGKTSHLTSIFKWRDHPRL